MFVNNVSLGLYAEAVQREGYREAKLRTILDTLPDALGPEGRGLDLRWTGPGGSEHSSGAAILVSNNRYRLGHAVGSGTRPRIDDGLLGITVAGAPTGRGEGRRLLSDRGASGRPPSSRSTPTARSRPASTARPRCWSRRSASGSGRPCCGCGSPAAPGRLAVGRDPRGIGGRDSHAAAPSCRAGARRTGRRRSRRRPSRFERTDDNERRRQADGHHRSREEGDARARGGRRSPACDRRHAGGRQRRRVRARTG